MSNYFDERNEKTLAAIDELLDCLLAARVLFAVERIRRQIVDKRFYIGGRAKS